MTIWRSLGDTASSCECVPNEIDGYGWNRWIGQNLHECIYTPQDWSAFVIGWTSLFFWLCCQLPQYYKNYQNKSADALSIVFLLEWFSGDLLNLISAVMTGQLTTQIATAALFICMDLTLCSQWFYYSKIYSWLYPTTAEGDSSSDEEDEEGDVESVNVDGGVKERLRTSLLVDTYASDAKAPDDGEGGGTSKGEFKSRDGFKSFAFLGPFLVFAYVAYPLVGPKHPPADMGIVVGGAGSGGRGLLSVTECDDTGIQDHVAHVVGTVLAYSSAAVYVTSRLPQIWKNYQRGSVEGLSPVMFMCAVMGNLTYALGVLVKKPSTHDLVNATPFLVGSLGTICFDTVILFQYLSYRNAEPKGDHTAYMRMETEVRERVPRGLHNIVDAMASPFFYKKKRVVI